jgi:hypothetical protein
MLYSRCVFSSESGTDQCLRIPSLVIGLFYNPATTTPIHPAIGV